MLAEDPTSQAGVLTEATIACPLCGQEAREAMPENACLYFYVCPGCGARLKPLPGDCCVFCSYADRPCPPKAADLRRSAL